jgi:hypothetical protein
MRNDSARVDYNVLVNRFGFPPLVKGENLDDFKKVIHQYMVRFGDQDGGHWALIWDYAIARWRWVRYTRIKDELRASLSAFMHPFTKTFANAWTTYIDGSDEAALTGDQQFENDDQIVEAIYRAHAEGKDVIRTLDCLIGHTRSDLVRLSRPLLQYCDQIQENIIDGEWEEIQ